MKLILTGATGMVGSAVLQQALTDNEIEKITVIVRRPVKETHPKLNTILHKDFMDYSGLEQVFRDHDACMWCLGISQNAVSKEQYVVITYEYAVAAAKAMLEANPGIHLLFLSGEGAKATEHSRLLFGRIKGKTENALLRMPFKSLLIARPAGILPVHRIGKQPLVLRMQYLFVRMMQHITPKYVITSTDLAKALLAVIKHGSAHTVISYAELNRIAADVNRNK